MNSRLLNTLERRKSHARRTPSLFWLRLSKFCVAKPVKDNDDALNLFLLCCLKPKTFFHSAWARFINKASLSSYGAIYFLSIPLKLTIWSCKPANYNRFTLWQRHLMSVLNKRRFFQLYFVRGTFSEIEFLITKKIETWNCFVRALWAHHSFATIWIFNHLWIFEDESLSLRLASWSFESWILNCKLARLKLKHLFLVQNVFIHSEIIHRKASGEGVGAKIHKTFRQWKTKF